jgi:1,4-dihydroxy-2-naphthoate polyprenyltransferase
MLFSKSVNPIFINTQSFHKYPLMPDFQSWVKAARLRTLPLALASIALGGFTAAVHPAFSLTAVVLAALTTLFLQILSNLANDYGDSKSGIDNEKRLGPIRTVQSGEIKPGEMRNAILLFAALSLLSGLALIIFGAKLSLLNSVVFLILGLAAIVAAINYTVGKNPYGYVGLGDLFVYLFFGLLGVGGTYFLATKSWDFTILLPASAMGLLSTGVLNLNNMRDLVNDKLNGKNTVAVKIGARAALIYHTFLVLLPFLLLFIYVLLTNFEPKAFAFLLLLPLFIYDLWKIANTNEASKLDPFLKKLALKTLLLTLVFGISLVL